MKFSREKPIYTFNGSASMTTNMRDNFTNERFDVLELLIKCPKLK